LRLASIQALPARFGTGRTHVWMKERLQRQGSVGKSAAPLVRDPVLGVIPALAAISCAGLGVGSITVALGLLG
jgi:hypothetical protein